MPKCCEKKSRKLGRDSFEEGDCDSRSKDVVSILFPYAEMVEYLLVESIMSVDL